MIRTRVGYTGGTSTDPTYANMSDHTEALQLDFDPAQISYELLLEMVWSSHDATRSRASAQYMAAIWCGDDAQLALARETGDRAARAAGGKLATRVERLDRFYRAEGYHQKYRLRREHELTAELVDRYGSDRGMVDSTAAARINGLLRGFGRREDLDRLFPTLDLTPRSERRLRSHYGPEIQRRAEE